MRRLLAGLALTATAAATANAATASKEGWDGFGVGSFVHQRTTTTSGMPGSTPITSELKQTLAGVTDDAWTVRHETRVGDRWVAGEIWVPRRLCGPPARAQAAKSTDLGTETLTVDGVALVCRKHRSEAGGVTTVTWANETHGILRSETAGAYTSSTTVTRLAARATVAGREIEVRETVDVVRSRGDAGETERKTTRWTSPSVPGGAVRIEVVSGSDASRQTVLTETIAFESRSEK